MDSIELEIGGQRIDKIYGHWMEVWSELTDNKTGRGAGQLHQTMSGLGQGFVTNNACTGIDNATDAFFEWFDRDLPMGSCVRWTGALQSLPLLGLG
jgi:hypothetical protein